MFFCICIFKGQNLTSLTLPSPQTPQTSSITDYQDRSNYPRLFSFEHRISSLKSTFSHVSDSKGSNPHHRRQHGPWI